MAEQEVLETTENKLQTHIDGLKDELQVFKEKVDAIDSVDELQKLEDELFADYDKDQEYIRGVQYDLADGCEFDGKNYSKSQIGSMILTQLNKLEVNWQMTLGCYELYQFWKNDHKTITYGQLDSTLRTLQQFKFKGFDDWKSILAINEYFKTNHEEYTKDMTKSMSIMEKHNMILNRVKLLQGDTVVDENDVALIDAQANAK